MKILKIIEGPKDFVLYEERGNYIHYSSLDKEWLTNEVALSFEDTGDYVLINGNKFDYSEAQLIFIKLSNIYKDIKWDYYTLKKSKK